MHLTVVRLGTGQPDRSHLGPTRSTGLLRVGRLAVGFGLPSQSIVLLDLDADLGLGELPLRVAQPRSLLGLDPLLVGRLLHLQGLDLLVGHFAIGQDPHELLGEDYVLDVNPARLHLVLLQLLADVQEGLFLH